MAESENIKDLESQFSIAAAHVKTLIQKLSNQQILNFYGLYKQATEGPCFKPKPSWYEITEKQKWEAWSQVKNLNRKEAMEKYIFLVNEIDHEWSKKPSTEISNAWIHHSCLKNNEEVIEDSKKTVFDWVKEKNFEKVKDFCKNWNEIDKLDENGMSLLHWAADRGSLDIVKYFVENLNANVNIQDSSGQTPLHYAVSCEYNDVAKYLLDSGADVKITDNDGHTPYDSDS